MAQVFQLLSQQDNIKQTTTMKFFLVIIAAIIAAAMAQNQEGGPQPDADAEAGVSIHIK